MLLVAQAQQLKASLLALLSLGQVKSLGSQQQQQLPLPLRQFSSLNLTANEIGNGLDGITGSPLVGSGLPVVGQQQEDGKLKYAVVVDCGSSGTRGHIFTWPQGTPSEELPNKVRPMLHPTSGQPLKVKIQPGLSSLKNTPERASDYMKPVMDFISLHIPDEAQPETPVYFLGTAGLRLLPQETQEKLLDDIARDLKLEYKFKIIHTRVISGISEGVYQWLSINAYSNRLSQNYDLEQRSPVLALKEFFCKAPQSRRFGMLEVGGASAQVTFDTTPVLDYLISGAFKFQPEALGAYERSRVSFKFDSHSNRRLNLFSTTFLGLGTNSARAAAIDLLVRDSIGLQTKFTVSTKQYNPLAMLLQRPKGQPLFVVGNPVRPPSFYVDGSANRLTVEDPCLPLGGLEDVTKPIELLHNQTKTIGFIVQGNEASNFTVRLIGRGNYKMCRRLLNRVIYLARDEHLNCAPEEKGNSCSSALIGTNFVPWKFFQFLGLSELFYTTEEMLHVSGRFNPHLVLKRTIEICSTPFDRLNLLYPEANRVDKKRTLLECFKATWLLTWLQEGLKMPAHFGAELETTEQINGNELDWTLGALISDLIQQ